MNLNVVNLEFSYSCIILLFDNYNKQNGAFKLNSATSEALHGFTLTTFLAPSKSKSFSVTLVEKQVQKIRFA